MRARRRFCTRHFQPKPSTRNLVCIAICHDSKQRYRSGSVDVNLDGSGERRGGGQSTRLSTVFEIHPPRLWGKLLVHGITRRVVLLCSCKIFISLQLICAVHVCAPRRTPTDESRPCVAFGRMCCPCLWPSKSSGCDQQVANTIVQTTRIAYRKNRI